MNVSVERNSNNLNSAESPQDHPNPVVVVGGSAAGFFTASLLARAGRRVQIIERSETLEPAARTLIVTRRMRDLLGPSAEGCVINEIRRFELFTDGRAATVSLERPDLIIERSRLIRGLAEQALQAGAELLLGRRFHHLEPNHSALSVGVERCSDGKQKTLHAETVVGGDGAASRVAQAAGWPKLETAPLIQAIVPLPKGMPPDTVRIWFIPQDTPYFYWLIPESPDRGALGLIGEAGADTRLHLERFLEKRELTPLSFQGARIPVYCGWVPVERRVGGGRVFIVGDAAAQVKVSTVGGIVTGFRGAAGVAEAILNGGRSRELRSLRRELNLHLFLRRTMHRFTQADYSQLVDLLNDSARKSLSAYSRDEALKVIWHLCVSQPRLILMGLRGLLARRRLFQDSRVM